MYAPYPRSPVLEGSSDQGRAKGESLASLERAVSDIFVHFGFSHLFSYLFFSFLSFFSFLFSFLLLPLIFLFSLFFSSLSSHFSLISSSLSSHYFSFLFSFLLLPLIFLFSFLLFSLLFLSLQRRNKQVAHGDIAQLARARRSQRRGRGFEPRCLHESKFEKYFSSSGSRTLEKRQGRVLRRAEAAEPSARALRAEGE